MKTEEFLTVLSENPTKELLFEYQPDRFVGTNYHITEIKNIQVKSVDCGGRSDAWNETIIQLWESPNEIGKSNYMQVDKALSIIERVNSIHPVDQKAQVFFEYSNPQFHKANLEIHNVALTSDKLIIKLFVSETDCKAKTPVAEVEEVGCCSGSKCC